MPNALTADQAFELVRRTAAIARGRGDDVSICVVAYTFGPLVPAAVLRMDNALTSTVQTAINKALTALAHQCDTAQFSYRTRDTPYGSAADDNWTARDVVVQQAVEPFFTPWGGAILLYSPDGNDIIGSLGLSGVGEVDEHEIAVDAATAMGFRS